MDEEFSYFYMKQLSNLPIIQHVSEVNESLLVTHFGGRIDILNPQSKRIISSYFASQLTLQKSLSYEDFIITQSPQLPSQLLVFYKYQQFAQQVLSFSNQIQNFFISKNTIITTSYDGSIASAILVVNKQKYQLRMENYVQKSTDIKRILHSSFDNGALLIADDQHLVYIQVKLIDDNLFQFDMQQSFDFDVKKNVISKVAVVSHFENIFFIICRGAEVSVFNHQFGFLAQQATQCVVTNTFFHSQSKRLFVLQGQVLSFYSLETDSGRLLNPQHTTVGSSDLIYVKVLENKTFLAVSQVGLILNVSKNLQSFQAQILDYSQTVELNKQKQSVIQLSAKGIDLIVGNQVNSRLEFTPQKYLFEEAMSQDVLNGDFTRFQQLLSDIQSTHVQSIQGSQQDDSYVMLISQMHKNKTQIFGVVRDKNNEVVVSDLLDGKFVPACLKIAYIDDYRFGLIFHSGVMVIRVDLKQDNIMQNLGFIQFPESIAYSNIQCRTDSTGLLLVSAVLQRDECGVLLLADLINLKFVNQIAYSKEVYFIKSKYQIFYVIEEGSISQIQVVDQVITLKSAVKAPKHIQPIDAKITDAKIQVLYYQYLYEMILQNFNIVNSSNLYIVSREGEFSFNLIWIFNNVFKIDISELARQQRFIMQAKQNQYKVRYGKYQ